jgi:hypothetical protein
MHICLSTFTDVEESSSSPVQLPPKSPASLTLPLQTLPFNTSHNTSSQRTPLLQASSAAQPNTDTDTDDSPTTTLRKGQQTKKFLGENKAQKYGHRKQISLYSWLSSTPVTSPNAPRQVGIDSQHPTNRPSQSTQGI